jgi:hypothetical protein
MKAVLIAAIGSSVLQSSPSFPPSAPHQIGRAPVTLAGVMRATVSVITRLEGPLRRKMAVNRSRAGHRCMIELVVKQPNRRRTFR